MKKLSLLLFLGMIFNYAVPAGAEIRIDVGPLQYLWKNGEKNVTAYRLLDQEAKEIVIPETITYNEQTLPVTDIYQFLFRNDNNLERIVLPKSVLNISAYTFENCTSLKEIVFPDTLFDMEPTALDGTAWLNSQPDGVVYTGKVAFKYKGEMPENYTLELKEGTLGITSAAFSGQKNLVDIKLPKSLKYIGMGAFKDCNQLTELTIPGPTYADKASLSKSIKEVKVLHPLAFVDYDSFLGVSIMYGMLVNDGKLESLYFNFNERDNSDVPRTGLFARFPNLKKVVMGDDVTYLKNDVFFFCTNLEDITFSKNLLNMRLQGLQGTAWYNNQPDGWVYAGPVAYGWKGEVTGSVLEIKEGIRGICELFTYDGTGLDKLEKLVVPSSVVSINKKSFVPFKNLSDIYMKGTTPPNVISFLKGIYGYAYDAYHYWPKYITGEEYVYLKGKIDVNDNMTIHVPKGYKATYEAHDVWSNYMIVDDIEDNFQATSIASVKAEKETVPVYDLMGRKVKTPKKGEIYIRGGKKYTVK